MELLRGNIHLLGRETLDNSCFFLVQPQTTLSHPIQRRNLAFWYCAREWQNPESS